MTLSAVSDYLLHSTIQYIIHDSNAEDTIMERARGVDIGRSLCEVAWETYKSTLYTDHEKEAILKSIASEWSRKASERSYPKAGRLLLLGLNVTTSLRSLLTHSSPWLNIEGKAGMKTKGLFIQLDNLHISSVCCISDPTLTKLILNRQSVASSATYASNMTSLLDRKTWT